MVRGFAAAAGLSIFPPRKLKRMEPRFYKKIYSIGEFYWILYRGLRTMTHLLRSKRNSELSPQLIERIMLAVTEVNGCEACSYAHTRIALRKGMSEEEIHRLLAGNTAGIPTEESVAIMFAQHYADTRGNPTRESWPRLVETYGTSRAYGILGATRAMMIGNAYGTAWSAFVSRLKGKPVEKSNVLYEMSMIIIILIFFPIAAANAVISGILAANPLLKRVDKASGRVYLAGGSWKGG